MWGGDALTAGNEANEATMSFRESGHCTNELMVRISFLGGMILVVKRTLIITSQTL